MTPSASAAGTPHGTADPRPSGGTREHGRRRVTDASRRRRNRAGRERARRSETVPPRELTINLNGVDDGNSDPTRLVVRLLITLLTGPLGSTSTLVYMAHLVGSVNCAAAPGGTTARRRRRRRRSADYTAATADDCTATCRPTPALSKTVLR